MSAKLLRRAAASMRDRANACPTPPWHVTADPIGVHVENGDGRGRIVLRSGADRTDDRGLQTAIHIASWHPTVALHVAEWLDGCADRVEETSSTRLELDAEERAWYLPALTVATSYLHETGP